MAGNQPWLYRGMPEQFEKMTLAAADTFKDQLQAIQDDVLAGGGSMNDARSAQAQVLALGIDWLVDEMRAEGATKIAEAKDAPLEMFIGILLNDVMGRFWMWRRIEGRDHPQMGDSRE